jgi:NhaA family Na+:H+ antiporter
MDQRRLMAVFFFLVGLELKREVQEGELSRLSQIALPARIAFGSLLQPVPLGWAFSPSLASALVGYLILRWSLRRS